MMNVLLSCQQPITNLPLGKNPHEYFEHKIRADHERRDLQGVCISRLGDVEDDHNDVDYDHQQREEAEADMFYDRSDPQLQRSAKKSSRKMSFLYVRGKSH